MVVYCSVADCYEKYGGGSSKHRFPNPAKNMDLFTRWVKLCQNKRFHEDGVTPEYMYANCRVWRKHFDADDFFGQKLKSTAIPHLNIPVSITGMVKDNLPDTNVLANITMSEHSYSSNVLLMDAVDEQISTTITTPHLDQESSPKAGPSGLLSELNIKRSENLTPKAKHFYKKASYYKKRAQQAVHSKLSLKRRLEEAYKFTNSEMFEKVTSSLDRVKTRFFEMQLENSPKNPKGRRYSVDDKVLALALFKQCGSGYKLLSKVFSLPSSKTVMRLINRIPIEPGLCEGIFDVLKSEAKNFQDPREKYCFLLFDEMSLKPGLYWNHVNGNVDGFQDFGYKSTSAIADHVQVFMLRGIIKNWKQPIFYNFVEGATKSPDIAYIIKLVIEKCMEAGLEVIATICDQGTNNVAAINSLVRETKENYLIKNEEFFSNEFEINGKKVVPLFDVPHLVKGIRNDFVNFNVNVKIDDQILTATWDHIRTAYKMDPHLGSLRVMPKLTDNHINPIGRNKMRVKYCTQVMSRTVAAAINLMAFSGTEVLTDNGMLKMERTGMETAKFIEFVDNLFDSLNGMSKYYDQMKPLKGPVNSHSQHFLFWQNAVEILSSLKYLKPDGSSFVPPSIKNFIKTIKNFRISFNYMEKLGFTYLLPRMFNQDPLENFFGRIRQRGARYDTPTTAAFTPFYKSLLVKDFTSSHSIGSNCEDDKSEIFMTLKKFVTQGISEEEEEEEEDEIDEMKYPRSSCNSFNPLEQQALKYVSGYLLRKAPNCFKNCSCADTILKKRKGQRILQINSLH